MLHTQRSYGGSCVAPHHLAASAGRDVLKQGGNAVEAMVAAAAAIAVVYPHMNALGGDGFWLIHEPGKAPVAIDACGPAAQLANRDFYSGESQIPERGPKATLTMAGTISGWQEALNVAAGWGSALPLPTLLADAIRHADEGIAVSQSQETLTAKHLERLSQSPGFSDALLLSGQVPREGERLRQPRLANTLKRLASAGLDDFYRGELAASMAKDLEALGSPLRLDDFHAYRAQQVTPLHVQLNDATLYNLPAPTQGMASLMILGIYERIKAAEPNGFDHLHGLIEATKRAFMLRDRYVTDPYRVPTPLQELLSEERIGAEAAEINPAQALPWPYEPAPGDTIWMGTVDSEGRSVSFIQSIYWEFGSGVVLPESGVLWQNRGISFSLNPDDLRGLAPGRKPFHTLNPALALFNDGRTMVYGTMGGEGQPQTQAAVFSRYALHGMPLQQAVTAPRWLLGRTWGESSTNLKLEKRFDDELVAALATAGHDVEVLPDAFSDTMGHAGGIVRHPDGLIESAHDPRSNGGAASV
ncbi:gamma-glutamyltransferase [Vreelandella aquamarina]|jgi:gamma-glutamyltranspeptidase/glutathione hydrolase|uniref:Gamma-glutamyltransferase n=1 Tax=Vreelandella aquamarina TaxID=77097 RepID=A0A1N6DKN2_9GAMM|nr:MULTISPECIES: gamma-glutamyltransferase family protein [Halomonas]MEC8902336.1 gamma-glutamyltransferase family protein [Pseudomonadota bacterium]MCC4290352.1 gamma-glutamyltransferase family protein [Halomonas axialensis]MCF2912114.1 gamma-glutamyltransferase family protein [Halomonas sp. Cn5-12]MCP1303240.1 gamma-glutamyltransferase family protein [Halomonas sp. R1t8]MCP1330173.1 gamma-glutamyltransferase family protein [Halomonas sp. R1t4]|tara:strand:- start:562 stop:2148 length:1587 start_codon:yes stop_codon:yes gene_type:complete